MNRRTVLITFISSLFSFIFSSRAANTMPNTTTTTTTQSRFALKFFTELVGHLPADNIIVSPSSIYLALSLLYNGAKEMTQVEMAKLLESQDIPIETLNRDNLALQSHLLDPDLKVTLSIANSLWTNSDIFIYPTFLDSLKYFYKAEVTNLDFKNPHSARIVNEWVRRKTNGKIDSIMDTIPPEQVLLLINAIYFKGLWAKPFDKKLTKEQPFHQLNGSLKEVSMMSKQGSYLYLENELLQAVSLPYTDHNISLDIFLPKKKTKFKTFLEQFNLEKWQEWTSKLRQKEGTVEIPRFKLEYTLTINDVLKRLGMNRSFDPQRANFSALTSMPVYVSEVLHKTYLEVNEEGTEAAAVTSMIAGATAMMPKEEPFILRADRPFVCILREQKTGSFLFMATIVNPS